MSHYYRWIDSTTGVPDEPAVPDRLPAGPGNGNDVSDGDREYEEYYRRRLLQEQRRGQPPYKPRFIEKKPDRLPEY